MPRADGGPTLGEPEEGEARLGSTAEPAALGVRAFGLVEPALEPMQLGLLVVSLADGRVDRRSREDEPGALHLVGGGRPVAVEAHELRPVDEALAAEHDVGLPGTPVGERGRPFLRTPHVEDRVARLDGRAVHHAGHRRRHLAGRHAGHRLVEEAGAAVALAERDQRLALPHPPEHGQVDVAEALRDRGDLLVRLERRRRDRVLPACPRATGIRR